MLQLSSWPLRDEPVRTSTIGGIQFILSVVAAYGTGRLATGLLVFGLLLAASWSLWLPVRFELGTKGIIRSVFGWRRRISWSEFAEYETHARGVFLYHHANQQPLTTIRGLFLPSSPPHTEVAAVLDYYLRARESEP